MNFVCSVDEFRQEIKLFKKNFLQNKLSKHVLTRRNVFVVQGSDLGLDDDVRSIAAWFKEYDYVSVSMNVDLHQSEIIISMKYSVESVIPDHPLVDQETFNLARVTKWISNPNPTRKMSISTTIDQDFVLSSIRTAFVFSIQVFDDDDMKELRRSPGVNLYFQLTNGKEKLKVEFVLAH